jgi:retron-type reverse transcriptase
MAVLDRFSYYFETSDHQFGFKKHLSCRHVIYSVRSVIESYIDKGSTVNVCALDMSKAYDRTNHFSLYMRLMDRKLPIELLTIFETWFCISETCVKWGGQISKFFKLRAGVRQGGVLSPFLFAIFLDGVVDKIKAVKMGCYNSTVCISIFLYADDILLLAPTVTGLQAILTACENELDNIDMRVNVKKSMCIRFGKHFNTKCANIISTHGGPLEWVSSCRYLGVHFTSGRLFRCCFDNAKKQFFSEHSTPLLVKLGDLPRMK